MPVAYEPAFTKLTGDLSTGVLLSQLVYWFKPSRVGKSKLSIERNGRKWLAKSRPEFMEETGLTEWQLRSAVDRLVEMGLVETEVHLFGNKTTPHFWLNEVRLVHLLTAFAESSDPLLRNPQKRNGDTLKSGSENSSNPYTEITAETSSEITVAPLGGAEVEEKTIRKIGNVVILYPGEKKMATANEILKNLREKKENPKKISPQSLAIFWKKKVSDVYGGFQREMATKEMGQFKLYLLKVGDPQRAYQALDYVLTHWGIFTFEAKAKYGLKVAPEKPVVGFVLEYYDVAVQLIATPPKKEEAVAVVNAPAPPQKSAAPAPEKVSKDAVAAALAMFQKGKTP